MNRFDAISQDWPAISRLLDEALDLPPERRSGWLAGLPSQHLHLRPLLESMLASDRESPESDFLSPNPVIDGYLDEGHLVGAPTAGQQVGPWCLLERLGEGGMSTVWLAQRADGSLDRPVALKLPLDGLHREALAERMAREREILVQLKHPNIAQLLDAGITTGGQPYLAIEFVDGRHIDDYCREEQLSVTARVRLVLEAGRAIAHAHSMLVVHRDLKPANILVTGDGQVRLLDFGIAKILDGMATRETELTRISGRAFTLHYASPEQIAGKPLTVSSDVYSLGVVLYELLTGTRPYELKRNSPAELEDAILEVEPPPPSRATADKATSKALRGDLDTIVMKALKKDPAKRYRTMDAFADDIIRYTRDMPVLAQRDSVWYRFSKFVRRHRFVATTVALVLLTLIAAVGLTAWQAQIARAQKRRAEEVKTFLFSILIDAHSYRAGRPLTALDLLKRVEKRMYQLEDADRETRVELLNILAACYLSLQDTSGAETAIEAAVRLARALPDGHAQALRARMLRLGVLSYRGQVTAHRAEVDDLIHAMKRSGGTFPEDLAATLRVRADLALDEGNAQEAEQYAQEALGVAESCLGLRHNQSVLALVSLSLAYQAGGKVRLGLEAAKQACLRGLAAYSGQTDHPNVLKARVAHGQALAAAGKIDQGIAEVTRAIEDESELFGSTSRAVGIDLRTLARLQFRAGQLEPALHSADWALKILQAHYDPQSTGYAAIRQLRISILHAKAARTPPRVDELPANRAGVTLRMVSHRDGPSGTGSQRTSGYPYHRLRRESGR